MIYFPLGDNKGYIELISVMGSDLYIVNDARVSYDKSSHKLEIADIRLLKYLIRHNHTSPFRGCVLKYKVKAPLYICRQWYKHHVASSYTEEQDGWNEVSFRYTKIKQYDFYVPDYLPTQSNTNKQKSTDDEVIGGILKERLLKQYKNNVERCIDTYDSMIEAGVSKEIARGVLPACMYTTFIWTVSLQGFMNFLELRTGLGAQSEIGKYAQSAKMLAEPYFVETFKAWNNYE